MEIEDSKFEELQAQSEELGKLKRAISDRGFESVDALLSDRDKMVSEKDKLQKNLEKSGDVIARQGAELGQLRKLVNEEGGTQTPPTEEGVPPSKPKPVERPAEEELVELEGKMKDQHWEIVDAFVAELPKEEALKLVESADLRRKLYRDVLKEKPVIPKSLRETVKKEINNPPETKIEQRFGQFLERIRYVPASPGVHSPSVGGLKTTRQKVLDTRTS